jgi:hypothetical protein
LVKPAFERRHVYPAMIRVETEFAAQRTSTSSAEQLAQAIQCVLERMISGVTLGVRPEGFCERGHRDVGAPSDQCLQ